MAVQIIQTPLVVGGRLVLQVPSEEVAARASRADTGLGVVLGAVIVCDANTTDESVVSGTRLADERVSCRIQAVGHTSDGNL